MLKCPSNSARGTDGAGCKTIAEHLVAFDKISCLPKTLNLSQLDGGQGIKAAFRLHKAKSYDSCRLQYNKTKNLKRAAPEFKLTDLVNMYSTRLEQEQNTKLLPRYGRSQAWP